MDSSTSITLSSEKVERIARSVLATINKKQESIDKSIEHKVRTKLKKSFWWRVIKNQTPTEKAFNNALTNYYCDNYISTNRYSIAEELANNLLLACKVSEQVNLSLHDVSVLSAHYDFDIEELQYR